MERRRRIPFALGATLLVAAALALGGGAAGASTAPTSLYVTDVTGGSLVPVDVASGTTGTVIPVGLQPLDVAITEDGETAYVTAREAGTVVPVALDAGSAGAPISVPCPVNIALVPGQPKAFVTQSCAATITPLDLTTNTAGVPIPVGPTPFDVTVSPDGETAYVTTLGDASTPSALTPVDVASGAIGTPILLGTSRYPASVVVTADGATAYVATQSDDAIVRIDLDSGTLGAPIPMPRRPYGLALSPDGTKLYATHFPLAPDGLGDPAPRDVTPVDLATGTALDPIPVGVYTFGIALTTDGATAFVTHAGEPGPAADYAVTPIALATGTAGAPIAFAGQPGGIAIRPAGPSDTTPPTLAPTVRGSGPGDAVLLNDPAAVATPNADDGSGSGVASSSCDAPNVASVGPKTLTCRATDVAGNTSAIEVPYVVQYRLVDLAPTDGTTARTGKPLQIRVSLARANGALVAPCTGCVVTFQAFTVAGSGQNAGPLEMRFHAPSQQFRDSWKPAASGTGTTRLTMTVSYPGTTVTTSVSAIITLT
jgi:DNA-binding beta-propeller fold protein YncE